MSYYHRPRLRACQILRPDILSAPGAAGSTVKKLSTSEIQLAVAALPGWEVKDGKLYREFRFADFPHAFAFMTASAIQAEAADHHPEWFNVYNLVKVWLVTHDVQGISENDVDMAKRMDRLWMQALGAASA